MQYNIIGGSFPAALCKMNKGDEILCQNGAMIWMDSGIEMKTEGGGIGKALGKMFTGEAMFSNRYIANNLGEIAFSASFPGEIRAIELTPGHGIIAQKGAYLASDPTVDMSVFFQKKIMGGFFGGEGFIMQKFTGTGTLLIEVNGSSYEYNLLPGEKKIIDTGYLIMMEDTCTMDIEKIKGVKNIVLGGEGLFNTVITGPGKILLQTMPVNKLVETIATLSPSK